MVRQTADDDNFLCAKNIANEKNSKSDRWFFSFFKKNINFVDFTKLEVKKNVVQSGSIPGEENMVMDNNYLIISIVEWVLLNST